jgi:hypothetical protein
MKLKSLLILSLAFSVNAFATEPKEDPSAVQAPGLPFGGPITDAFGYSVTDSSGATCLSQFVDISATGTSIASGDDVSSGPFTLATPFNLYGDMYADLVGSSNGYISTDPADTGGDLSNDCPLPASPSTGAGARIYPLHDDLVVTDLFYEFQAACARPSDSFPSQALGCHIFQWSGTTHFGVAGTFSSQAILYDLSWEIVFVHDGNNIEAGSGSTTGIQNLDATVGLTHSCDTAASIPANSAQCFVHPNPSGSLFPPAIIPVNNKYMLSILFLMVISAGFFFVRRKA